MSTSTETLPRPAAAGPLHTLRAVRARAGWAARLNRSHAALAVLLIVTAVAYIWNLTESGYANSFYAAAVQAGTKSWKAFFFGSLDSSNFITVDKPPASLWVMALAGRLFGFSSASMLIPQALEGVAAVGLLYAGVRRWFGTAAGFAAGAMLAATPVAALMFRFNNPDALLVLLLVAAAYCLIRALEHAGTKWVLAAGAMIGFAFLAKMMQSFLVLPAFALVYVVAAPTGLRRRLWQLAAGGAAIVVSAGWWVAIVALWPVGSRPMIDGSPDNNIFNLIFGYNGLGRIFGSGGPGGGGGGGRGGANFSGPTGLLRLFDDLMGGQASWLLPAALLALVAGLWWTRRAPRTDRTRAALLLWGGWLIVSGLVFSLSSGIIHTYYTVALAPALAALVAIGGRQLWDRRDSVAARTLSLTALAITAGWSWELLDRTPSWEPWLRWMIVIAAVAAASGILACSLRRPLARRIAAPTVALALVACLAGPVAYSAQAISTAHTGSIPSAGPSSGLGGGSGGGGGAGHGGAGARSGGPGGAGLGGAGRLGGPGGTGSTFGEASGSGGGVSGLFTVPGAGGSLRGGRSPAQGSRAGGGAGGVSVSAALRRALEKDAGRYRWVAATSGSTSAASIELSTGGEPVMAIGGFDGQGGNLSLAQFEKYVDSGEIHYYVGGGGGFGGSGSSAIETWVQGHYKAVAIDGQTVYDLTQPASS
ncbi:MAG: ArnT family glycosyltransferase [Solirubrobacteraceae bacterium]